ncbi:MAG: hypothetical protein Q4Q37_05290, partial [Methanobrevibacter sp.]|nr:hypothetical protein [Methanobrevibacter sp.]
MVLLIITLTILSVSLGCVSAQDIDDTNSTVVSIDENSQEKISFDDTDQIQSNHEDEKIQAAGDYVQIKDHKTGKTGTITTSDSSVSIDMTWSGAGGTILYLYVDDVQTSNTYQVSLFENSGSADSAFTYTFPKTGTYAIKVDTGSHIYESNHLTYIYQNGGTQPGGENGTTPENGSASISIYDMAHPSDSTITSEGDYVSDIAYNIVKSGDGFSDESLEVIVNGNSVGSTTPNSSNRLGNLTFTEDAEWTLTVVYTATVNGKTVTATSNTLTFITRNTSGGNSSTNGTTPEEGSASISIYDMAHPSDSTITSEGDYVSDIAYTIVKSGDGFSDESLEVIVNGNSVGSTTPNSSNRLGNLTFTEDAEWTLTVVYTATVNGKTVTATSNTLTFITRNTSGGNSSTNGTTPEDGSASISIYDMAYPDDSTITSEGDYVAKIVYDLVKSGDGFSDESFEVFVNGQSVGFQNPNTSNRIGDITINEDNEWNISIVYSATFNGKTITATSNVLKYITKNTSGGNSSGNSSTNGTGGDEPQPGEIQVIIRDANNPNAQVINLNGEYNVVLEYYVTLPEGNFLTNDLIISCNGNAITTVNPADKTYANTGVLMFLNETGDYVFTAKYMYVIFMGSNGEVASNSITYHVVISNQSEQIRPAVSISIQDVVYPNQATAIVESNIDGVYDVVIGDEKYEVAVSNGRGSVSFTLPANTYTANVVSRSNSSIMNSTTFTVNPKAKTAPTVKSSELISGSSVVISLEFPNDIDGETVTVTLNGKTSKQSSIEKGIASVEFSDLIPGDYSYAVDYQGNENYTGVNEVKSFTIEDAAPITNGTNGSSSNTNGTGNSSVSGNGSDQNNNGSGVDANQTGFDGKTIVASDLTRGYASPYDFKAEFYDNGGKVLKNSEVNFIVNGNDNIVKTDEYGVAKLAIKLSPGIYNIEIRNYATGEVATKKVTIVGRIIGNRDINVDYSYGANYKIRLYADNGQAVGAGESVIITLNNVKYTVNTDKDGYATFKVNGLLPKTYAVTAEYKGVKVSNKVVVKQVLKAKNAKFK